MSERRATTARRAKLRRRRTARVSGLALAVLCVVGLALAGSDEPGREPRRRTEAPEPRLPEGCERARPGTTSLSFDAPRRVLESARDYRALIRTSCGEVAMDLFEDGAPINVNSFVFLARRGFYDGLPWHRVERQSVIQSGDPNGRNLDPPDGPGYTVPDETQAAHFDDYVYGIVGMANAGPDTAGSQFFIVTHDAEGAAAGEPEPAGFRPRYTIIGRVVRSSWGVLARIASIETKGGIEAVEAVEPAVPVVIDSIEVTSSRSG
jgi:cyclophilin family peptidyl-prolyl cis-trans isomerase